jgi:hypothetical protein
MEHRRSSKRTSGSFGTRSNMMTNGALQGMNLWFSRGPRSNTARQPRREYIDGNSSSGRTFGHNHPHITAAIRDRLDRVAPLRFSVSPTRLRLNSHRRLSIFSQQTPSAKSFLRRRFHRNRGRLTDCRSMLASKIRENTSLSHSRRLSWRHGRRGQPRRQCFGRAYRWISAIRFEHKGA